jgi:hypothetical protein
MDDVTQFTWHVAEDGYRWVETPVHKGVEGQASLLDAGKEKTAPQWGLTDEPSSVAYTHYQPLESETGLYRRFIEIDPLDRDSILAFAHQYGMLGLSLLAADRTLGGGKLTYVETEETWKREIRQMQHTVSVGDMFRDKNVSGLSQVLHELGPGRWQYKPVHDGQERIENIAPVDDLFVPGNIIIPAGFLVQRWINQKLASSSSPQVLYDVAAGRRVIRIMPRSLIGAMWLQLAQTIDGSRYHKPCKECSRWFEVSTESTGKRINREFCSDACKSKNYRRRKAEALELKAQGASIASIAKKLDTDQQTIKSWVSTKKG